MARDHDPVFPQRLDLIRAPGSSCPTAAPRRGVAGLEAGAQSLAQTGPRRLSSTFFARMKTWKILRDCRLKGDGVRHAMLGIARLHNLALTG